MKNLIVVLLTVHADAKFPSIFDKAGISKVVLFVAISNASILTHISKSVTPCKMLVSPIPIESL